MKFFLFFILLFFLSFKNNNALQSVSNYYSLFDKNNLALNYKGIYKEIFYQDTLALNNIYYNPYVNFFYTHFLCFYNNGFCINNFCYSNTDSISAIVQMNNHSHYKNKSGGVYYIKNNNLYAIVENRVFNRFGGMKYTFSKFEGEIINKDTIINFKLSKPYSKPFLYSDTIGKMFVFKTFPAKLQIDSTNFWIKQFVK